jgi:hypothetical protein
VLALLFAFDALWHLRAFSLSKPNPKQIALSVGGRKKEKKKKEEREKIKKRERPF